MREREREREKKKRQRDRDRKRQRETEIERQSFGKKGMKLIAKIGIPSQLYDIHNGD